MVLALMVALGIRVNDSFGSPKPGKVLYIDSEMNTRDMKSRLKGFVNGLGANWELFENNFKVLSWDNVNRNTKRSSGFYQLGNRDWMNWLQNKVEQEEFDLVVIDNATTMKSPEIKDINSDDDVMKINRTLLPLRAHCSVILIHHQKAGANASSAEDARGSGSVAWERSVDITTSIGRLTEEGATDAIYVIYRGVVRTPFDDAAMNWGRVAVRIDWSAQRQARDSQTITAYSGDGENEQRQEFPQVVTIMTEDDLGAYYEENAEAKKADKEARQEAERQRKGDKRMAEYEEFLAQIKEALDGNKKIKTVADLAAVMGLKKNTIDHRFREMKAEEIVNTTAAAFIKQYRTG